MGKQNIKVATCGAMGGYPEIQIQNQIAQSPAHWATNQSIYAASAGDGRAVNKCKSLFSTQEVPL